MGREEGRKWTFLPWHPGCGATAGYIGDCSSGFGCQVHVGNKMCSQLSSIRMIPQCKMLLIPLLGSKGLLDVVSTLSDFG